MRIHRRVPAWVRWIHVLGLCVLVLMAITWVSYEMQRMPQELARLVMLGCFVLLFSSRVWELLLNDE
ncbi:MAG: hypothetical protein JSV78_05575 [Phycisphaerales bacterium]|nr:MAG: hypothetical protein JSV78_05575 [Phycisphaerales bacterium]